MQAHGHDVVHDVVALGDLVKHLVDEILLLAVCDFPEAIRRFHPAVCGGAAFCHSLNSIL